MSKLGTIVLTSGVESVPEKQGADHNSSNNNSSGSTSSAVGGGSSDEKSDYLPAAGAFAVPVKRNTETNVNVERSAESGPADA